MSWVVIEIGCLECGVSSAIAGHYATEEEAIAQALRMQDEFYWREGGQNSFEAFEVPAVGTTLAPFDGAPTRRPPRSGRRIT